MKFRPSLASVLLITPLSLLLAQAASAGNATWNLNPGSSDWNDANNWTPATVPNGPDDVATFGASNTTSIGISSDTEASIVFGPGASAFIITVPGGLTLSLSGAGVQNDSGIPQTLSAAGGSATGTIAFTGHASAADANIISNGATAPGGAGGLVDFRNSSTADSATLVATAGQPKGVPGGVISFSGEATGGTPRIELFGNGKLNLRSNGDGFIKVGSIEGDGQISLGDDSLIVGSNSRDTVFSGIIADGSSFTPLIKIGHGTLTLGGPNTYDGDLTLIESGTLLVTNKTGFGTGYTGVQLDSGTFGGTGKTYDGVTAVGNAGPATISPGNGKRTGTLTIEGLGVSFNPNTSLRINIDTAAVTADKLVAVNVFPGAGSRFTLIDRGNVTLPVGTVFTVIDASNLLVGTFQNLPDGGTVTAGPNTYQANYEGGGDGHDLTLTVQ